MTTRKRVVTKQPCENSTLTWIIFALICFLILLENFVEKRLGFYLVVFEISNVCRPPAIPSWMWQCDRIKANFCFGISLTEPLAAYETCPHWLCPLYTDAYLEGRAIREADGNVSTFPPRDWDPMVSVTESMSNTCQKREEMCWTNKKHHLTLLFHIEEAKWVVELCRGMNK